MIEENKCFSGHCKHKKQGTDCMHCASPKAIQYYELTEPCPVCGREPGVNRKGCGNCIGRGRYIYPGAYEDCDCGGYEITSYGAKLLHDEIIEEIKIAEALNSY